MKKNLYIFCFFFITFFASNVTLFAQWETMEGPFAGSASLPVSSGGALYVTSSTGIYKSDNDGDNWYCISFVDGVRLSTKSRFNCGKSHINCSEVCCIIGTTIKKQLFSTVGLEPSLLVWL